MNNETGYDNDSTIWSNFKILEGYGRKPLNVYLINGCDLLVHCNYWYHKYIIICIEIAIINSSFLSQCLFLYQKLDYTRNEKTLCETFSEKNSTT